MRARSWRRRRGCIGSFVPSTVVSSSGAARPPTRFESRPELEAAAPNDIWTWDITRLRGPGRRNFFYLYVLLDLFSRYVPGWMLAASRTRSSPGASSTRPCTARILTRRS